MSEPVIVLDHLTKNYGSHRGVADLSLTVEEGEIFGFIGPNGAGKSTTIRVLMGLIRPTSGRAALFGKDCWRDAAAIARDTGYIPSDGGLYNAMRVRDLLQYTADLYKQDCAARMKELSERLDLDLSRRIGELSMGNRKKVGIVSALMTSPRLLVMDEPTSGLDPLVQQTFYDLIREENRRGATVFLSSHVLSEVQRLCGRVAILREGTLAEVRSIRDLREQGYKKVHVTGRCPLPADAFRLDGVTALRTDGDTADFLYNGPMGALLARITALDPQDVFLEEPSLEEIFLHYYE